MPVEKRYKVLNENADGAFVAPVYAQTPSKAPEAAAPANNLRLGDIIKLKLASGISKVGGGLDIGPLAMMSAFKDDGSINITDAVKAKVVDGLMSEGQDINNLPIDKLMLLQMLEGGTFDINALIMMKLVENL